MMKKSKIVISTVALAFLSAGTVSAFAQETYRPLTVGAQKHTTARRAVSQTGNDNVVGAVGAGVGGVVAAPFNAVGGAVPIVGGAISGVGDVVSAPFNGLSGGTVGISNSVAPPLPIKARYAGTGAVETAYDEGYSQDVPVDKGGPIYQIDNAGNSRAVTPFTLLAFPVEAATSIVTMPLRRPIPHS